MERRWCMYCKNEITENEPYVVDKGDVYHQDCHIQMNTYNNPYGDDNGEEWWVDK